MLVAELPDALAHKQGDAIVVVDLGDVKVDDEASSLEIGHDFYSVDEVAEKALCTYLKIPNSYFKRLPPEERARQVRFWCERYAEVETQFNVERGHITSIHSPELLAIPNHSVAAVVTEVFEPTDRANLLLDYDQLHLDVISEAHRIEVLNPTGVPFRPQVGDVTGGGIRILTYPHQAKDPSVCAYFERLVCTNGMTTDQKVGTISIKGSTVSEVIEEMESAAHKLLASLDNALERYAATARTPVPGNLQSFAVQLAGEYKIKREVLDAVMLLINQLPEGATVYDVIQAFTAVAGNELPWATRMKLQALGGTLALDTERMIARCATCERLL